MFTKTLTAVICAGAMLAGPAMADDRETEVRVNEKAEARLAKRLEGRVAGEPVRCIPTMRNQRTTVYDDTAVVWQVGSKLYVNRPDSGRDALNDNAIMVTETFSNQLCNIDTIRMVDQQGFMRGIVFLGDFVPYDRVDDEG